MEKLIGLPLYELEGENLGNLYFDENTTEEAEVGDEDEKYWATYNDDGSPILTKNGEELEYRDVIEYFKEKTDTEDDIYFDFDKGDCYERKSDGEYVQSIQFFLFSYPSQIEIPAKFKPDDMGNYKESICLDCYAFDDGELSNASIDLTLNAQSRHYEQKYYNIRLVEATLHTGLDEYKLTASLSQNGKFEIENVSL